MDVKKLEPNFVNNVVINSSSMTCLGSQLRNIPIPSPPSISSSSDEDSDDLTDEDDNTPLECFLSTPKADMNTRLLLTDEDVNVNDLSNLTLVGPETQARLEALLEAAGVAADGKAFTDPEVLRRLTSSVSSALDEAAAALTRMRTQAGNTVAVPTNAAENPTNGDQGTRSLVEACIEGDIAAVRKLLEEGRSVHEPTDEGESLLSLACSAGYYELVQVLLAMNANVEDRGSKGDCTPLMEAASGGFVDILRLLLQHGANVNAQSSSGNTALHYACCSGYEHVVQVLVEHRADLEHQNENGHTPLMEAASGGHVKVAKLLLDHNAGINTHSSEFKESALTLACYKGHVEMVEFLLERGADQEHKTDEMHTALMEASMDGHVEVARLLLEHGAQVNMPADSFESPLTLAACGSHVELAQLLIEHGAKLEEVNDEGYTPLMEASREGYLPMVALLLEHGAAINGQTEETQETALTLACCGGFQEVVGYLLDCGADIELGASTPLMEAATEGHVDLVRFLLEKGANVNAATATGDVALTYAAENGHMDVSEVLIEHGGNIEHESEGGRTPLMKAARAGHLCMVEFLISKGADVNRKTTVGDHSVLSLACAGGHAAVVELLLGRYANPSMSLKDNSSMLIEAAKGGHTAVACLLIDTPFPSLASRRSTFSGQDSTAAGGSAAVCTAAHFPPPVSSAAASNHSSFLPCPHLQSLEHMHHLQHCSAAAAAATTDCSHACLHPPPCGGYNPASAFTVPPAVAAASTMPAAAGNLAHMQSSFQLTSPMFLGQPFLPVDDVPAVPPTDLLGSPVTDNPLSIAAQLSLSHLTPADLQSLAQALSFSSNINNMLQQDQQQLAQQQQIEHFLHVQQQLQEQQERQFQEQQLQEQLQEQLKLRESKSVSQQATQTALFQQATPQCATTKQQATKSVQLQTGPESIPQQAVLMGTAVQAVVPPSIDLALMEFADMPLTPLPSVDPRVESFTTQSEVCTPSPSDTTTSTVTSAGKTIASTGVQTEDAISMIQKLTNSVHQLNALQSFAAAHNLELVNFGEITLPPSPFPLDIDIDVDVEHLQPRVELPPLKVVDPEPPVVNTAVREEPVGECSPPPLLAPLVEVKPTPAPLASPASTPPSLLPALDIDQATESNHDTALTIAAAGGHDELIQLLLSRSADIEHRDKKGCTPLILAATAGHCSCCQLLLDAGAEIEAQSDRTKDTALSLACSSGRQEVVELLLIYNANYEHRNVSDYTPLSLAASGGYVGIIKVLLNHGAEINSRTGSKLGISPLMLAAMNGHVAAVKLLLDMGSDVNAQIETNRNTALTLACFQGRTEVVGLLLDRKANVEHRAKTGLTPLMEAASGGYVEVGRVLIDRGADVNAPSVPSSRDTALTIAADKGHYKFVELLVIMGACVDVKNKKGCTPLWLAANGGHLDVVQLLAKEFSDVNSTDNRGVSCLMAAFRKGNTKVVKWLVRCVSQFPADSDLKRFMQTLSDKELMKKLEEGMQMIIAAKKRQEAEANKNASILLEQLDSERKKEERRKVQAQKKRDKKKQKKKKKAVDPAEAGKDECNGDLADEDEVDENDDDDSGGRAAERDEEEEPMCIMNDERPDLSTAELKLRSQKQLKKKVKKRLKGSRNASIDKGTLSDKKSDSEPDICSSDIDLTNIVISTAISAVSTIRPCETVSTTIVAEITKAVATSIMSTKTSSNGKVGIDAKVAATMATAAAQCAIVSMSTNASVATSNSGAVNYSVASSSSTAAHVSPKKSRRAEDGWKEVTRRSEQQRSKKILIPASLISRVIGRGGCNVNAIRDHTTAHIDIDTNRKKANGDCMVTIKGSQQATRNASAFIESMIQDPDRDVTEILPARPEVVVTPRSLGSSQTGSTTTTAPSRQATGKQHRTELIPTEQWDVAPVPLMALMTGVSTTVSMTGGTKVTDSKIAQVTVTTYERQVSARVPPGWGGSASQPTSKTPSKASSPRQHSSSQSSPRPISSTIAPPQPPPPTVSSQASVAATVLSSSMQTQQVSSCKSSVVRRLVTTTVTASTTLSPSLKQLPRPIGSNRPTAVKLLDQDAGQALSSTSVTGSITATLHSTLTNLLSQVATQRSPHIWNGLQSAASTATGSPQPPLEPVLGCTSASTTSPTTSSMSVSRPDIGSQASVLSRASSVSSEPHSRTPSLSPTLSNQSAGGSPTPVEILPISASPAIVQLIGPPPTSVLPPLNVPPMNVPVVEQRSTQSAIGERPHLNPIGSERGQKRTAVGQAPNMPNLLQGMQPPTMWSYEYKFRPDTNWTSQEQRVQSDWRTSPAEQGGSLSPPPHPIGTPVVHPPAAAVGKDETLADLLERLSLSDHLQLLQSNEIDLDALMLMSEQDYADIGLAKEPRMKLLNSIHQPSTSPRNVADSLPRGPIVNQSRSTADLHSQSRGSLLRSDGKHAALTEQKGMAMEQKQPASVPGHVTGHMMQEQKLSTNHVLEQKPVWNDNVLTNRNTNMNAHAKHGNLPPQDKRSVNQMQPTGLPQTNHLQFSGAHIMSTWQPWSSDVDQ